MAQRGFTATELLIAVALFVTLSGMGMAFLMPAITAARSDSEVRRVVGMLQLAREIAISQQRDVELRVDEENNFISLVRLDDEGNEFLVAQIGFALENGLRFERFTDMGVPEGIVDGAGAVEFGGALRLLFLSDGSLVGNDDVPVNGALFMAVPGKPDTARAVTITGTTARPRSYRWIGNRWNAQ
jgi:prepilin-type N-terminal cleavage/methylation domain-containing protein